MRCPECKKELLRYHNGESFGIKVPSYPYESGYYCPNKCVSYSDLEISRGTVNNENKD